MSDLVESFITLPIEMNLKTQKFFKYLIPSYSNDSMKTIFQHIAETIKEQEVEWEEMYDKSYESPPYYNLL